MVLGAILVVAIAPACEEFFFRGFFYRGLRSRFGIISAALIDGLVFGAIHYTDPKTLSLLPILAVLGFLFCLLYERTGTLLATISLHAINNGIAYGSTVHGSGGLAAGLAIGVVAVCVAAAAHAGPSGARRGQPRRRLEPQGLDRALGGESEVVVAARVVERPHPVRDQHLHLSHAARVHGTGDDQLVGQARQLGGRAHHAPARDRHLRARRTLPGVEDRLSQGAGELAAGGEHRQAPGAQCHRRTGLRRLSRRQRAIERTGAQVHAQPIEQPGALHERQLVGTYQDDRAVADAGSELHNRLERYSGYPRTEQVKPSPGATQMPSVRAISASNTRSGSSAAARARLFASLPTR